MREKPAWLGIECGGTHSTAIAATLKGERLATVSAGPANLRLVTDAQLQAVFAAIAAQVPQPVAIGIGVAGCRDSADRKRVEHSLAQIWPGVPTRVSHDLETAWWAAGGRSGTRVARVIVLAGTGSCAYGHGPAGADTKVGGWGHWLGDRGSAYDIAHRALRNAIARWDRQQKWGPFGAAVLRRLLLNSPEDLIAWAQSASKSEVARVAIDAFEEGRLDPAAKEAIRDAGRDLSEDATVCMKRIMDRGAKPEFVLAGGLFEHRKAYADVVRKELRRSFPKSRVVKLVEPGAWGGVLMAQTLAPITPRGLVNLPTAEPVSRSVRYVPRSSEISPTERRNPRSMKLDSMPLDRAIDLMLSEEERIPGILKTQKKAFAWLINRTAQAFSEGGRLFYVGAGTSGRLGVLDASECPPTFRTPPGWVQGIMAGGEKALHSAVEGAEDDFDAGAAAIRFRNVDAKDVVLGVAASGRTPFVWGALNAAREAGAFTSLLCFNPYLEIDSTHGPDQVFAFDLGPEVLTGSTRLKSGTATKLFLNGLTTLAMVRIGKVVGNLMVDLNPSNVKLRDRAVRIVVELAGCTREEATLALEKAQWVVKDAVAHINSFR